MVDLKEIRQFSEAMAREFRLRRVTLFGSYARGEARSDSDVDLLVEMRFKGSGLAQAAEIIKRLRPRFAVDLIVRTPQQLKQRLAWKDPLLQEAVREGKVLYEAPDA